MTPTWLIKVYSDRLLATVKECDGPFELGRQDRRSGESPFEMTRAGDGGSRIAIAPADDLKVSRRHARVERSDEGGALVRNTSESNTVGLEDGEPLRPGQHREVSLPATLRIGGKVIRIERAGLEEEVRLVRSLEVATAPPGSISGDLGFSTLGMNSIESLDARSVFDGLRAMIQVLQSAASGTDFFEAAARAAVEVVGLDSGRVLVRVGDRWEAVAHFPPPGTAGDRGREGPPSRMVLNRACDEKKVCWFDPSELEEDCSSLEAVSSVVAAPVQSRSGEVIAVLYGDRKIRPAAGDAARVTRLDAILIEVLAVGLAAGLARIEQERAALASQARFEQFFTPELARVLAAEPGLLDGKDLEISVLFCDIRGFSRITRHQAPALTMEWTQDVMTTLSAAVLAHGGVLVDYIGDELVAMWGAPEPQPDHAERACRAALEMLAALDGLNRRWEVRLGEPIRVGIGVNSGPARVGNTGSRYKFKYGPLGDTVNVASRVEGASKYFKASVLVTRSTRDRLGPSFETRRLGTARVINIAEPIGLFELYPAGHPDMPTIGPAFEEALLAFEAREFRKATGILGRLVSAHPEDGPSFALLARAIGHMVDEPESFDPAFRLKGK